MTDSCGGSPENGRRVETVGIDRNHSIGDIPGFARRMGFIEWSRIGRGGGRRASRGRLARWRHYLGIELGALKANPLLAALDLRLLGIEWQRGAHANDRLRRRNGHDVRQEHARLDDQAPRWRPRGRVLSPEPLAHRTLPYTRADRCIPPDTRMGPVPGAAGTDEAPAATRKRRRLSR